LPVLINLSEDDERANGYAMSKKVMPAWVAAIALWAGASLSCSAIAGRAAPCSKGADQANGASRYAGTASRSKAGVGKIDIDITADINSAMS